MSVRRTVCHRCGATVAGFELATDKVNVATVDDLKLLAFWCAKCSGILCPECAGIQIGEGIFFGYGFCPVCSERAEPATPGQIEAPMSQALKKLLPKPSALQKWFGAAQPVSGTFAYLFVVTQFKQPTDSQIANQYLFEIAEMFAQGWRSTPAHNRSKLAALWDTEPADRAQLISWASKTFGEEFKALSTKYDLSFSRFEHRSGNGQVLIARNR